MRPMEDLLQLLLCGCGSRGLFTIKLQLGMVSTLTSNIRQISAVNHRYRAHTEGTAQKEIQLKTSIPDHITSSANTEGNWYTASIKEIHLPIASHPAQTRKEIDILPQTRPDLPPKEIHLNTSRSSAAVQIFEPAIDCCRRDLPRP
jgi:hypothetical protein